MKPTTVPAVRVSRTAFTAALVILLAGSHALADDPVLSTPNPAAAYCENLGYEYAIVDGDGGQHGVCVLPDGRRVDAWEFYRGKVAMEYSYCAQQGLETRTVRTDHGSYTTECAVCVSEDGRELGTVAELMGLSFETARGIMPAGDEDGKTRGKERFVPRSRGVPFGASPPSGELPERFNWRQLDGTTAEGQTEELAAHADTEDRDFPNDAGDELGGSRHPCRIAGSIRQQHACVASAAELVNRDPGRHHAHREAFSDEAT